MLDNKAKRIIIDYIKSSLKKINVKSGTCRYNYRCHNNSVHDALNNNDDKIAMCFYIDDGYPIIHFLNVDRENNFIDNTLGRWSEKYDYYLIKYIYKKDFFDIIDIFEEYRFELKNKLPLYIRILSDIEF